MGRRSWRNFDYVLLITLWALSAFGVIMIYSATINTLGVENPVQRQILYVIAGTVVLLVTAAIDYRLLHILQVPISVLTPIILIFMNMGLVIVWRAQQVNFEELSPTIDLFTPDLPVMIVGAVIVCAVFVLDLVWIQKLDLAAPRFILAGAVLAAMAAVVFFFVRSATGLQDPAAPTVTLAEEIRHLFRRIMGRD